MDAPVRQLVLYKRWSLRAGVDVEDVLDLVRREVQPAHRRLSGQVQLALELSLDGSSVVAIQRWPSQEVHAATVSGPSYSEWWADYEPRLAAWDRLVEFVSE
jgi:hypothetical protein